MSNYVLKIYVISMKIGYIYMNIDKIYIKRSNIYQNYCQILIIVV